MLLFPEVLISIGQQCFNSCRVTTKEPGKRKEQNGGVNSRVLFEKTDRGKQRKKAENFLVFLPLADKVPAENLTFAMENQLYQNI